MQNIIYEYEKISNQELEKYIIESKDLHKSFTLDWKGLKSSNYCGILNFDNQNFYILPKIANSNNEQNLNIFIYMLMYTYDIGEDYKLGHSYFMQGLDLEFVKEYKIKPLLEEYFYGDEENYKKAEEILNN